MTGDTCASLGMRNEAMRLERLESKRLKTKERETYARVEMFFPKCVYVFYPTLGIFKKETEVGERLQPSAER